MSDLAKKLAQLSSSNSDGLDNPMCEDASQETEAWDAPKDIDPWDQEDPDKKFSFLASIDESYGKRGKNKRKNGFVDDLMRRNTNLQNFSADRLADSLDSYLDELDEGDAELRDSLISMGRKYHRDTSATGKPSEISKAYASAEKRLRALHAEIADDKAALQKDIDQMRLARSRNHKALSELIEAKNSMHNAQLSIIKEINHMRKDEFDLKQKEAKIAREEGGEDGSVSSNTLRSLFSIGRGSMVDAMGGYEAISGARTNSSNNANAYDDEPPDLEEDSSRADDDNFDDRFLEFEELGVQLVVLIDEDEHVVDVIAEDKNGNSVYNYPMPTDYMNLNYNINRRMMTATDDYHRNYKVRVI